MRRSLIALLFLLTIAASPLCGRASSVYDYDDDEYEMPPPPPPPPQDTATQAPPPPRAAPSSQTASALHAFGGGGWLPFGTATFKMQKAASFAGSNSVSITLQPHPLNAAESKSLAAALQTCAPYRFGLHSDLGDDTSPLVFTSVPLLCMLRTKMELQLRAAFDGNGRLRSIWHEDKACAAAAAACNSDVTAKLAKLLPSLTTISLSVLSEAPTLLPKVPLEIKASYASPNAADPAKEQKQKNAHLSPEEREKLEEESKPWYQRYMWHIIIGLAVMFLMPTPPDAGAEKGAAGAAGKQAGGGK